jgi:hypothetical protein
MLLVHTDKSARDSESAGSFEDEDSGADFTSETDPASNVMVLDPEGLTCSSQGDGM